MKLKTPLQIHKYREDKKELEFKIKDTGRRHATTLDEHLRLELIALHLEYKYKYLKEYKG